MSFEIPENTSATDRRVSLTVWIPLELKEKYEKIQGLSQRKFSKHISKLICKEISSVKLKG